MTGHRPFAELRKAMAPERRARNAEATQDMLRTMALHELRQARGKAQAALAQDLHVGQSAVAKMEQRTDMYVSNLRRYIEALGGTLEITARFPDGEVRITNFGALETTGEVTDSQRVTPVMIGKAERGPAAMDSIRRHGAATLIAVGGAASLVSKAVKSARVLAFADLGMEAIHEFVVQDMPVTVAVDATGASVHQTGPSQWKRPVVKRVFAGIGT